MLEKIDLSHDQQQIMKIHTIREFLLKPQLHLLLNFPHRYL